MTQPSSRGPRGPRRRPVLRHHLEDDFDRELDRLHGAGRSRRRDRARRAHQYEHLARRLLEAYLDRELADPELGELQLVDLHLHPGNALLTVHVSTEEDDPLPRAALEQLEHQLRAELCHELPRRHTPQVRVVLVPGRGGDQ